MEWKATGRGFVRGDFRDSYNEPCSIQESSNMDPHVWFGTNENRMHLTPAMARELAGLLLEFADDGDLRKRDPRPSQGSPAPRCIGS